MERHLDHIDFNEMVMRLNESDVYRVSVDSAVFQLKISLFNAFNT